MQADGVYDNSCRHHGSLYRTQVLITFLLYETAMMDQRFGSFCTSVALPSFNSIVHCTPVCRVPSQIEALAEDKDRIWMTCPLARPLVPEGLLVIVLYPRALLLCEHGWKHQIHGWRLKMASGAGRKSRSYFFDHTSARLCSGCRFQVDCV